MTEEDGTATTSLDEIHDQFLCFYKGLLGKKQDVIPIETSVMDSGLKISSLQA